MGVYDTVWVKCPKCGFENDFQSKSGDCILANFNLDNCPENVLLNVNRHSPCVCKCGAVYDVDIEKRKAVLINNKTNNGK